MESSACGIVVWRRTWAGTFWIVSESRTFMQETKTSRWYSRNGDNFGVPPFVEDFGLMGHSHTRDGECEVDKRLWKEVCILGSEKHTCISGELFVRQQCEKAREARVQRGLSGKCELVMVARCVKQVRCVNPQGHKERRFTQRKNIADQKHEQRKSQR